MKRIVLFIVFCLFLSIQVGFAQNSSESSGQDSTSETSIPAEKVATPKKKSFLDFLMFWKSDKKVTPVKTTPQKFSPTSPYNANVINFANLDEEGLNYYFVEKAKEGKIDDLIQLLKYGADINCQNSQGRTALIEASRIGNIKVVQWLIDRGASVNAKDNYDGNALIYATQNGRRNIVNLLIQGGARKEINP